MLKPLIIDNIICKIDFNYSRIPQSKRQFAQCLLGKKSTTNVKGIYEKGIFCIWRSDSVA